MKGQTNWGGQTISYKQTDKRTDKQRWTNNIGQINRQTGVDKQFQTNKQTNRGGQTISCKQIDKWTDKQPDRQSFANSNID